MCYEPSKQDAVEKKQREEQNGGLGLRWRIHNQALNPKRGRN